MADSLHVGIGDVPPVPGLGPEQGWVGMTVQFLVDSMQVLKAATPESGNIKVHIEAAS